jgi:N-sulfoglucosamine sulfohydrolase
MLDDLPDLRTELAQYWNSVQRLDVAVGNILKALEETGEADNTVIVFSSDHGMPFPFAKATCYDHGTRVPVLISWPGMGAPRRFDNLTTNVDILPTLLDLLGVAPPPKLDGRSWLPIIRGEASAEPEFQFTYVNTVSSGMSYPMRGIQDRRYALLFSPWSNGKLDRRLESMAGLTFNAMRAAAGSNPAIARRVEEYVKGIPLAFYDLREDPGQRVNLIEDRRHAARITRMKQALLDEMQRTADPQRANFKTLLAGGIPTVPQDPERYKLRNGGGE